MEIQNIIFGGFNLQNKSLNICESKQILINKTGFNNFATISKETIITRINGIDFCRIFCICPEIID